jgi:hypothetical protein
MVWPADLPERDEVSADTPWAKEHADIERKHRVPHHIYVQISVLVGAIVISAALLLHAGWLHFRHSHVEQLNTDHATVLDPSSIPSAPPAAKDIARNDAAIPPTPAVSPTPSAATVAAQPREAALPLLRQWDSVPADQRLPLLEDQLVKAINAFRTQLQQTGPLEFARQNAEPFLQIQMEMDKTLRQLSGRKSQTDPKSLRMSRNLATARLLAAEFQSARNCLLDLKELAQESHGEDHAETLITDYLLALTDLSQAVLHNDTARLNDAEALLRESIERVGRRPRVSSHAADAFKAALERCRQARTAAASPGDVGLRTWIGERFPMTPAETQGLLEALQLGLQAQK